MAGLTPPTELHRTLTPDRVISLLLLVATLVLSGSAVLAVTIGVIAGGAVVWLWVTDPDQP